MKTFEFLKTLGILLLFVYLTGALLAWDLNPLNWLLFTELKGRIALIAILMIALAMSADGATPDKAKNDGQ